MGYTREEVREMIAIYGAGKASNIVYCNECPYANVCSEVDTGTCEDTLRHCNYEYIESLSSKEREETTMTNMLPDNTVQINPQGEVTGLDSLSLADLAKLSAAARDLLDRKSDEYELQLWDNVVKAVKEYCKECSNIVILCNGDDSLEFNHTQMNSCGTIDCE